MDPKSLPGGWPAFPTDNEQQNGPSSYHYEGMSLRDYLAAKAMQGICAHPDKWGEVTDGTSKAGATKRACSAQSKRSAAAAATVSSATST